MTVYNTYTRVNWTIDGTPINTTNLNNMDAQIALLDAQTKPANISASTLTYTNGNLTEVLEKVSGVNYQRSTLSYTNGVLTGINVKRYATNGSTIIEQWNETLTYTNGVLTSTAKAWV